MIGNQIFNSSIEVAYLCNETNPQCDEKGACGMPCKHTFREDSARNPETVMAVDRFIQDLNMINNLFDIEEVNGHIVFTERELEEKYDCQG